MNPKVKLLLLIIISTSMLLYTNLMLLRITLIALVGTIIALRLVRRFVPWLKPLSLAMAAVIILQAFTFNGVFFSFEGMFYGFLFAVRLCILVALVFIFVETTPASKLAEAFNFLPKDISQVLVLAMALIPSVTDLAEKVINAQKSRAMSFRTPNIFRTYFPVLVPIFGKMLYRAEHMSLAMEARGYGSD